ncbi:VOC family protein [Erythrobacter sp. HL-111]|uniref:VOC family protein n=1 Tax=Erythrobacter sp. HL-111 TaxID=1798193 RepID=UPI003512736F
MRASGVAGSDSIARFGTEELDPTVASLKEAGLTFTKDPVDESRGRRGARLADPAGNLIRLCRAGADRHFPDRRIDGRTQDTREDETRWVSGAGSWAFPMWASPPFSTL